MKRESKKNTNEEKPNQAHEPIHSHTNKNKEKGEGASEQTTPRTTPSAEIITNRTPEPVKRKMLFDLMKNPGEFIVDTRGTKDRNTRFDDLL